MPGKENVVQIGCGVVGGAYAKAYVHHGFSLTGFDVVPAIIDKMNDAGVKCFHPDDCPSDLNADIVLLSVPTPLIKETQRLDMKYVWSTIPLVVKLIEQSSGLTPILVIRSTVPPGTTLKWEAEVRAKTDKPFQVAFQPEFLRAVSCEEDARAPWQIVFGCAKDADDTRARMSNCFLDFVGRDENKLTVLTIAEAEFMKLVHNYANGLKISFANCIYGLAHELDPSIDAQKVLYLVSSTAECFLSRKYGLRVGAPYGGVCLPKDVPELTSLAPEGSVFREFLSGTGKINEWITNTPSLKVELTESPNWVSPSELNV
ncbi:unnamed protein product [Ectocarpus sp. 6 AP-2014]|uniref:GDP-mannose 6-dehydrogenase n=1 Tax=Ectocarpus siliculosus TaxID=2880 RepID=D7FM80_ECTSI|nr:GDP-mannose 6-dehydrogenase [Ectocarpus siliculosus]|eukprot:CBJ29903.1 GDP-mannose 6-dehydrogenase [Ectocarpus siliculosus]